MRRPILKSMAAALLLAAGALVLATATNARAADKPITIAIYAPNAPFQSGGDRFTFINRLAQQVSSVVGVPATGRAFARASDLEAAIRNKQVDFAVLDGVYLAERGVPYQVLATATSGGDTAPRWALFAGGATRVDELQGKKLSLASTGGRDSEFISNALFDGEVQIGKFFASQARAPEMAAAVQAVALHKADAVFAPESMGGSLKKVFDVRDRVPNPAFCEVAPGLSPDLVGKVKAAVLGHGAAGPGLDGWKPSSAEAYRALNGRMGARTRRPVMVEPDVVRIEEQDVLVPPPLEPGLPDLKPLYWQPSAQ
ncbi:MAG TPA: PhnD/SsuA/transferrin family substrate-binding protein [Polyangia bacterium]|nr:PhnD/SsuA/transferrin family substrate-binding protein [Polyangia bacterium]